MDYLKVVGENLLPVVFTILTPILLLLVKRLVSYLEKKWDFQITQSQEYDLMDLISRAIAYAEEKAMAALKTGDDIPDGAKKLEIALEFAMSEIKRMKLDEMAKEKLTQLIESVLNKKRATGEISNTLKSEKAKKLLTEG
jgi:hypothetical protein